MIRETRILWILAAALALAGPASAVSTTMDVSTPQGSKTADFTLGSWMASDSFEVSGTLDAVVEFGASPLDTTLEITGADLHLTDMLFRFDTFSWIQTFDLVATLSSSTLSATGFDGIDTYFFDLTGSEFTIDQGIAHIFLPSPEFFEDLSSTPVELNFEPGSTARLTVTEGSVLRFDLLLPLNAYGTNIGGHSGTELRFSEQQISLAGVAVPEPSTGMLLAAGLLALAGRRHRPGFSCARPGPAPAWPRRCA